MTYEPVLYALALAAVAAFVVVVRRLHARVLIDDAERALRDEFPEWR